MAIYAVIVVIYMATQVYFTAKTLDAGLYSQLFSVYLKQNELTEEIERLTWPENRPVLIFDSWGEVPHEDPRAQFTKSANTAKNESIGNAGSLCSTAAAVTLTRSRFSP